MPEKKNTDSKVIYVTNSNPDPVDLYKILNRVLTENGVPEYYYSLGEPAEECVCLEERKGKWYVYEVSRGHIIHSREFSSFYQACCDLFESVVIGEDKINLLKRCLKTRIILYGSDLGQPYIITRKRWGKISPTSIKIKVASSKGENLANDFTIADEGYTVKDIALTRIKKAKTTKVAIKRLKRKSSTKRKKHIYN